jgi:Cu/Ag efflux protein CusF
VFAVPDPALLRGLKIGDRVTVTWEQAGAEFQAMRITRS